MFTDIQQTKCTGKCSSYFKITRHEGGISIFQVCNFYFIGKSMTNFWKYTNVMPFVYLILQYNFLKYKIIRFFRIILVFKL